MKLAAVFFVILSVFPAFAQSPADNADLTKLFTADQTARQGSIDWQKLRADDDQREVQLHHMLEAGEVRTANDYYHAALIFQHGQTHQDYLLAHVLVVNAIALGKSSARWLAAATLDRYLLAVSQPQIYGPQFESPQGSTTITQEPWTPHSSRTAHAP